MLLAYTGRDTNGAVMPPIVWQGWGGPPDRTPDNVKVAWHLVKVRHWLLLLLLYE